MSSYAIRADDNDLYYPGDKEYTVIDPEITLKMNQAGIAKFTVPATNPMYDSIKLRKSMVSVIKTGREVFYGEVKKCSINHIDHTKQVIATGALSFLNDSIQPQEDYGSVLSVDEFLDTILGIHNQQMMNDSRKIIWKGTVYVRDESDIIAPMITDRRTTLEEIRRNLLDVYGGVLKIRHEISGLYLDYFPLNFYGEDCEQEISIGYNIMDAITDYNTEDMKTVIIPLGAKLEDDGSGFEKRLTIKTVNNNKDYLVNTDAKNIYGAIWTTKIFDNIDDPVELYGFGSDYIYRKQFEYATIKVTAADLASVDADMSPFYFGDAVQVYTPIVNGKYYITEMTMKPLAPEEERITISGNVSARGNTLTGAMASLLQRR